MPARSAASTESVTGTTIRTSAASRRLKRMLSCSSHALLISSKALNFHPDSTLSKQFKFIPVTSPKPSDKLSTNSADTSGRVKVKTGYVWVKKGSDLVQTPVKIGLDDNTHAEILDGLSTTDEVVSSLPVPATVAPSGSILPPPPGTKKKS